MLQDFDEDFFLRSPAASLFPQVRRASSDLTSPANVLTFKVDVTEDKNSYLVKCELPGLIKDDIKITVEKSNLVIQAERKEEKEIKEGEEKDGEHQVHIREFSYGKLYRSFSLPENADPENIQAAYDKGVLSITLPKVEPPKEKTIEIKAV